MTDLPRVGIQVSSFRNGPYGFEERARLAGSFGFEGIELIHQGPRPSPNPAEITAEAARGILDSNGLVSVAAHFWGAVGIEDNLEEISAYHRVLGTSALLVAIVGEEVGFSTQDAKAWSALGKRLDSLAKRCADIGFALGVHNHVLEMLPVDGRIGLYRLFDEQTSDNLFWEADIGHIWASKTDLSEVMDHLGDKCRLMHFKDLDARVLDQPVLEGNGQMSSFEELSAPVIERIDWESDFGQGVIDIPEACRLAVEYGVEWVLAETHKPGLDLRLARDVIEQSLAASL